MQCSRIPFSNSFRTAHGKDEMQGKALTMRVCSRMMLPIAGKDLGTEPSRCMLTALLSNKLLDTPCAGTVKQQELAFTDGSEAVTSPVLAGAQQAMQEYSRQGRRVSGLGNTAAHAVCGLLQG